MQTLIKKYCFGCLDIWDFLKSSYHLLCMKFSRYVSDLFCKSFGLSASWRIGSLAIFLNRSGSHLSSRVVTNQVLSAVSVFTGVFGMLTCVTPIRIATWNISCYQVLPDNPWSLDHWTVKQSLLLLLERRWSSRRFSYGYLVTTSPQSSALP